MRLGFALLMLLALASGARAQVSASAYADRTVLSEGETLTYTLEVTGVDDLGTVTPPVPSSHLQLVSQTPSFQRRSTFGTQTRLALGWRYRAVASGAAQLGGMSFSAAGRVFTTDRILIDVTRGTSRQGPSRQRPNAPLAPSPQAAPLGRDLFVRAEPRQGQAVVGEQIVVDYVLYFDPERAAPRKALAVGTWDAQGFWREEMDVPTADTYPSPVNVGGRAMQRVTIRRLALFPARSGALELAPMDFDVEVRENDTSDPFAPFFSPFRSRRSDRKVTAPAADIAVVPLPPGAPDGFSGAVGTFEMSARAQPLAVAPGDPVELVVTLRGTGNAATLAAPAIDMPANVDAYDPASERSTDTARSPLSERAPVHVHARAAGRLVRDSRNRVELFRPGDSALPHAAPGPVRDPGQRRAARLWRRGRRRRALAAYARPLHQTAVGAAGRRARTSGRGRIGTAGREAPPPEASPCSGRCGAAQERRRPATPRASCRGRTRDSRDACAFARASGEHAAAPRPHRAR